MNHITAFEMAGLVVLLCTCTIIPASAKDWDIPVLDTARNVDYLSAVEKDVILELNMVRSDPRKYAELYVKPYLALFDGKSPFGPNSYKLPSGVYMTTMEGARAVRECYDELYASAPSPLLTPSRGMSRAAKDHVLDQGPRGTTGHTSSNGASMGDRLDRYGQWNGGSGENISYGFNTGRDIVLQLLLDDGVPSRGHRKNNMNKNFTRIGVAAGSHKSYGSMAVIDFANAFQDSR